MSIKYIKVKKKPTTFNRLFGVSVSQFEAILSKVSQEWQKQVIPNSIINYTNSLLSKEIVLILEKERW